MLKNKIFCPELSNPLFEAEPILATDLLILYDNTPPPPNIDITPLSPVKIQTAALPSPQTFVVVECNIL